MGAALDYIDGLGQFLASLSARAELGDHICLAAQPVTPNGTPDVIVDEAVEAGARITGRWASELVRAVGGLATEHEIHVAMDRAAEGFDLGAFADLTEQEVMRGVMLGSLDDDWELVTGDEVAPATFAMQQSFAGLPFQKAAEFFASKQVLTPEAFNALQEGAKQKAFTVANLAKDELLHAAHAELLRMVREGGTRKADGTPAGGANLRDFQKFAKARLESAGWTPANPSHTETIFRTNIMTAYASGRVAHATQPKVLQVAPYWQIHTVRDSRQRGTHRAAHGIVLPASHPFWFTAYPPFGYNCFLPGTTVQGSFVGASRAPYSGKAIELTTAKGRRLSVTANHPILTRNGFVPAQALCEGDELVGYGGEPGVPLLGQGSKRHENQAPARVEDVFSALAKSSRADLAVARPDDFHGEAKLFVGHVKVVGSYGALEEERMFALPEERYELGLKAPYAASHALRTSRLASLGVALSATRGPGSRALPLDCIRLSEQLFPLHTLRIGAPTELDSLFTQDASDGLTTDSHLYRELLSGRSGLVSSDKVASVREFDFSGHVYDFQTRNGWLAAGGIVASNCRCRTIVRTRSWVARTNATVGPVPRGLPDRGFDSGTRALIQVPAQVQQAPTQAPMAPPLPRPVPQAPRPAPPPRKRGKPRKPKVLPPQTEPVRSQTELPTLGRKHFGAIVTDLPETAFEEATVPLRKIAGVDKYLEKKPIRQLTLKRQVKVFGREVNGAYAGGRERSLSVATERPFDTWGQPWSPGESWSLSQSSKSPQEAVSTTLVHEFAHHVHLGSSKRVDGMVRKAYANAKSNGTAISRYAATDHEEYFAETFTAYHLRRDDLRARDPVGLAMVEQVVKLVGL